MALVTIDSHYLLYQMPNWVFPVEIKTEQDTEVETGILGQEERSLMRVNKHAEFSFTIGLYTYTNSNYVSLNNEVEDILLAANLTGKICVPLWPKTTYLIEDATATDDTLTFNIKNAWGFEVGDYVFISERDGNFEIKQIQDVSGSILTLDSNLINSYSVEKSYFLPLFFGSLEYSGNGITNQMTDFKIKISSDNFTYKFLLTTCEDDFQSYYVGDIEILDFNSCVQSGIVLSPDDFVYDHFQDYDAGSISTLKLGGRQGEARWKAFGLIVNV